MKKLILLALALCLWPAAAKADSYGGPPPMMPYCGQVPRVRTHRVWVHHDEGFVSHGRRYRAGWYRWDESRRCWYRRGFGYTRGVRVRPPARHR